MCYQRKVAKTRKSAEHACLDHYEYEVTERSRAADAVVPEITCPHHHLSTPPVAELPIVVAVPVVNDEAVSGGPSDVLVEDHEDVEDYSEHLIHGGADEAFDVLPLFDELPVDDYMFFGGPDEVVGVSDTDRRQAVPVVDVCM